MMKVGSWLLGFGLLCVATPSNCWGVEPAGTSPESLFAERIVPIFKSPNPSSCVQCHLASVDLKDYIRPSSDETFIELRNQGLIDVKSPGASKILTFIAMGEEDQDKGARLIHAKTRAAELEAFRAWVLASCEDSRMLALEHSDDGKWDRNSETNKVIRHSRKDRVLDSFVRNIWSQRMRCFPCHTPAEIDPANPKHAKPAIRYEEYVAKFGQRMNIFKETPAATMQSLIVSSSRVHKDTLPLINVSDPKNSLLLLKPTAKIPGRDADGKLLPPSSALPVSHVGGLKMHVDDFSYKSFMNWLIDYSKLASSDYSGEDELPVDNWFPSKLVVKVKQTPETWESLSVVQIFVHPWDAEEAQFSTEPIAFTQTRVGPRGFAIGTLFLIADDDNQKLWNPNGQQLPKGKYELRAYLDPERRVDEDPTVLLNDSDCVGVVEIDAQWVEGFANAEVVEGSQFHAK